MPNPVVMVNQNSLDGNRILKDFQSHLVKLKKEWDEREKTMKDIVKETFNLISIEINYDGMQSFLRERIKASIDNESAKKLDVMFFFEETQINRLYYFKPNSKNLSFYYIDLHLRQKKELNIDFKIPVNFACVQTKSGTIYLTGGSQNETDSWNTCY